MFIKTLPDGTYNFNVAPTTGSQGYYLSLRNSTLAQYGTGIYASLIPGGGTNKCQADKITVAAGGTTTASMALVAGGQISGTVTDGTNPLPGIAVRFQDSTGAYAESVRTAKDGTYSIWVQPGSASPYNILCRGQQYSGTSTATTLGPAVAVTAGATPTANFETATIGTITGTVQDASSNPVGAAFAYVYEATSYNLLGYEITAGDGTFEVYGPTGANVRVAIVVSDGRMIGSLAHSTTYNNYVTNGTNVAVGASLGTVSLPAGGVLAGTVTQSGSAGANSLVQFRYGGKSALYRLSTFRTMSDGSYTISLPAGTITRLCAAASSSALPNGATPPAAGTYAYNDGVSITAGSTTTAPTLAY